MGYPYSPGQGQDSTTYQGPPSAGHTYKPPRPTRRPKPRRPIPNAPTRPTRPHLVNPFAPKTDEELRAEAQAMVSSSYGPLIQQIRDAFASRSREGQAAILAATQALGNLWSGVGPQSQAIYDQARGTEQGQATQLAQALGSFGQNLSGEQANALALQDAPASVADAVTGGTVQTAQGASNANLATQTAESQMLNTQGAAAGAYGAKLPGIAGLRGLQNSRDLEHQLASELSSALGDANSRSQESFASILQHLMDNEIQKAAYNQSGMFNQKKLQADQQYKAQQLRYKKANDARNRAIQRRRLGISEASVRNRAIHDGVSEAQAQQRIANERASQAERNRADRAREAQAARSARERQRHNRVSEKNKGKGGKAPWHK